MTEWDISVLVSQWGSTIKASQVDTHLDMTLNVPGHKTTTSKHKTQWCNMLLVKATWYNEGIAFAKLKHIHNVVFHMNMDCSVI